jgi:hypothetical protein
VSEEAFLQPTVQGRPESIVARDADRPRLDRHPMADRRAGLDQTGQTNVRHSAHLRQRFPTDVGQQRTAGRGRFE